MGRISDADRERVRDANRIEAVIGDYVALKRAGGGNLKGLCPFHDEKSPSFTVSLARGFYHCFGCGEGGDVFDFLMKIDQLSFVEAVQQLAERAGITITMNAARGISGGERTSRSKLTSITRATAEFFSAHLADDEATPARTYLTDRGFDAEAERHFGCGFAPGGWDTLMKHLLAQGFSVDDMIEAGVVKRGQRGPIDQFHRRLTWAIRDASGDVVGFGARRIFDDDKIEAKYVNTSGDGRLYRKSQVMYGLDLAKRDIVRDRQVVVVEGYTDVMAMHLAGVTTAVAACGTAFGEDHIGVLRRYLMDSDLMRGEVVYVFDGDAAGQKAALKAFDSDQKFAAFTFVAVAEGGMDPCDMRQRRGDAALRELVRSRSPLFRFAIGHTLSGYDLETVEGRGGALAATAPLVGRIKDPTTREGYIRELAERVGVPARDVEARVRAERRRTDARPSGRAGAPVRAGGDPAMSGTHRNDSAPAEWSGATGARSGGPDNQQGTRGGAPDDQRGGRPPDGRRSRPVRPGVVDSTTVERETLKIAVQFPAVVANGYAQVDTSSFTDPDYGAVHAAIIAAGGPGGPAASSDAGWVKEIQAHLPSGALHSLVTELAVESLNYRSDEPESRYAGAILARMAERHAAAQERDLVGALKRAEAVGDKERAALLAGDLGTIGAYRRALADRIRGAEIA
ncbi:MAG: DNA primase [Nakamurella sp.]